MKTLKIILFSAVCLVLTAESCAQKSDYPKGVTKAQVDSLSYSLGMMNGMQFQQMKVPNLNMPLFNQAIGDVMADKELNVVLKIDMMAAQMFLNNYFTKMRDMDANNTPNEVTTEQLDSLSYSFGMMTGMQFQQWKLTYLNMSLYNQAIEDVMAGKELKYTMETAQMFLQSYFMKMQEIERAEMAKAAAENLEKGQKFLAENKTKEGVIETPSGLQYKVISEGSGPFATAIDTVEVHYLGTLIDGTKFDSSYDRGETISFPLNGVIRGWTEGMQLIPEGSKAIFYIPSELAYGSQDRGPKLPGNSTLIFEVELIKVKKATEK